jgi:hypothetical protein
VPLPEILRPRPPEKRLARQVALCGGLLAIAALAVAGYVLTPPMAPAAKSDAKTVDLANSASDMPGDAWSHGADWDAAAHQIKLLESDADMLANEVGQLWEEPALPPSAPSLETMP